MVDYTMASSVALLEGRIERKVNGSVELALGFTLCSGLGSVQQVDLEALNLEDTGEIISETSQPSVARLIGGDLSFNEFAWYRFDYWS